MLMAEYGTSELRIKEAATPLLNDLLLLKPDNQDFVPALFLAWRKLRTNKHGKWSKLSSDTMAVRVLIRTGNFSIACVEYLSRPEIPKLDFDSCGRLGSG